MVNRGNFSLFTATAGVLSPDPPVQLKMPTPDLQGPEGLVHVAKDKLLAMTGEETAGWGLVVRTHQHNLRVLCFMGLFLRGCFCVCLQVIDALSGTTS